MDEPFVSVGLRIRALRGDLSLREFAARLGVDHKSVSGWESGKRLPDGSSLLALMEQFAADVNYILTGQRTGGASAPPPPRAVSEGDRILLDNFHAAPAQVQAGVKTTLGAFADASAQVKGRRRAA